MFKLLSPVRDRYPKKLGLGQMAQLMAKVGTWNSKTKYTKGQRHFRTSRTKKGETHHKESLKQNI
jgi:hypothetical protein